MRLPITPLLFVLMLPAWAVAFDQPVNPGPAGTLAFTNGDWLPGILAESIKSGELAWQGAAFVEPFRFDAGFLYLKAMHFNVPRTAGWKEQPQSLLLTNGDVLYGALESLGADDLVFVSSQAGRIRIKRSAVRCWERCGEQAAVVYAGPSSADEWTRLPQGDAWRESDGGLATYLSGAALRLDAELPPQAMIELELSWKVEPDFEILLGAGKDAPAPWPACRLECVDGALIVRRETEQDIDLQKVHDLGHGEGRIRLLLLLDQPRQSVQVFSDDGVLLATIKTDKDPPQQLPGVLIKHRSGRLRLEQLRISRWSGGMPSEAILDVPRIHRADGEVLYGKLTGFDPERQTFQIAMDHGQRECNADQAERVFFCSRSDQRLQAVTKPGSRVYCADGTRLSGCFDKVAADRLYWECNEALTADALGPVSLPVGAVRNIEFRTKLAPPSRMVGDMLLLELDKGQLHGTLAAPGPGRTGLGWQPAGSETASALCDDVSGSIDFPATTLPGKLELEQLDSDKLYLRTGDVLRCRIVSVDHEGVVCQAASAPLKKLPHVKLKAIELGAQPSQEPLAPDKRERLLTLPRLLKDDPPTHVLGSVNGDYLRGRLMALTEDNVVFEAGTTERSFERRLVARIVWLHPESLTESDREMPPLALPKGSVQIVRIDGTRVSFVPQTVEAGWISGVNELLGACRIHVEQESELLIGNRALQRAAQLPFGDWKLAPAAEPLVMNADSAGGNGESDVGSQLLGRQAPDFELTLLNGQSFSVASRRGKVVVLDFWASWCAPCMQSLPKLAEVLAELPTDRVEFTAVNLQQTPEEAQAALRRLGLSLPVAVDRDGKVAEKYGATSIPYTVVIDADGKVAKVFVGSGARLQESVRTAIKALLSPLEKAETGSQAE